MSNIPSSKRYIQLEGTLDRKPISQDLLQAMGGSINYILDSVDAFGFKYQEFNVNGTWTAPTNATSVMLIGCGGGGGGGVFLIGGGSIGTSQGGLGALTQLNIVPVTGGQTYTILIGAGGNGGFKSIGSGTGASGLRGGSTFFKFGSSVLCEYKGGAGGGLLSNPSPGFDGVIASILIGKDSANYLSGTSPFIYAQGGSAGPYGAGGNGAYNPSGSATAISASSNSGAGGGSATAASNATGGTGGSGKLFVIWF